MCLMQIEGCLGLYDVGKWGVYVGNFLIGFMVFVGEQNNVVFVCFDDGMMNGGSMVDFDFGIVYVGQDVVDDCLWYFVVWVVVGY